jgi:hypothetical protein
MMHRSSETLARVAIAMSTAPAALSELRTSTVRRDPWVTVVLIALALVVAVGLIAAWWIVCQNKGMYPALDMPSFSQGGTWKVYCRS